MMKHFAERTLVLSVTLTAMATALVGIGCSRGQPTTNLAEQGEQLYAQNCQSCHGDAATGAGRTSPLVPSHGPNGHTWHHADGQIVDIVLGRFTYPGREMPSFAGQLTEEQVEAILAYIKLSWNQEMVEFQAEVSKGWEALNR